MRQMRKIKRKLSDDESRKLLDHINVITISMYDEAEAVPYSVIMNCIVLNNIIYVHCAKEGRKIDVLKKNSNVCITALANSNIIENKYSTAYESLVISSHARFIEKKDEKIEVLNILCRNLTPNNKEESNKKIINGAIDKTTIIAFDIESISGKGAYREYFKSEN